MGTQRTPLSTDLVVRRDYTSGLHIACCTQGHSFKELMCLTQRNTESSRMRRQMNTIQMKKTSEKDINEMKISHLPDKEFKVIIRWF